MPILGYGEDALTFHALSAGLDSIFRQLGDSSNPRECTQFFRPSFGRRGAAPGRAPRSEFGEFDAIIGTCNAVYLVEAKWTGSTEFEGATLALRPQQQRRHEVFRIYLNEWRRHPPDDWEDFGARVRPLLMARVAGVVPPSAGTTLAQNLNYVLGRLANCGPKVVDVLLFCSLSNAYIAPSDCGNFCVVTHCATPEIGSGFVRLSD